ncbi:MAG: SigE family RNA polymerase sigma factor [Actinomycetota bacterium]|nr:SigE family RNA polymerase sigma factor [Actinomycetota bacterium]
MMVSVEPDAGGRLVAGGAEAALAEVYRTHYGKLVGLARLLVDQREQAEEVVQDAFMRTYAARDRLRGDPLAYVRQAVVNESRSALRRRRTIRGSHLQAVSDGVSAEAHVIHDERLREVSAAVRVLPPRQRECVVLRYYEDCSTAQTAAALGISEGSVKANLHRALAALGVALEEER